MILSVLALVGVLATQAFYSSVIDDVTEDLEKAAETSSTEELSDTSTRPRAMAAGGTSMHT